jgi:hypothetical protein
MATGGWLTFATMIIEFYITVNAQVAVAVGSSPVLGNEIKSQLSAATMAPKHIAKTRWNRNLHMALNAA